MSGSTTNVQYNMAPPPHMGGMGGMMGMMGMMGMGGMMASMSNAMAMGMMGNAMMNPFRF